MTALLVLSFLFFSVAAAPALTLPSQAGNEPLKSQHFQNQEPTMSLELRDGRPDDATVLGRICFEAFKDIAHRHHFPEDFPSPEAASGLMSFLLGHPKFHAVVAEAGGQVIGGNYLDERSAIAGVGPIFIDPAAQGQGAGRRLMEVVIARAQERGLSGVRLVQVGYNNQTLCLYSRLGFQVREPLSLLTGTPARIHISGYDVRKATAGDTDACNRLCREVHGHDRAGEVDEAIRDGSATVVERQGRITGYATSIGFFAHAVGETTQDLKALIGAADQITGPGILVPTRNHDLFTWCIDHKLRLVQQMTLMTMGFYQDPTGAYLSSVLY